MRGLPARRIASTALCATLLVGLAGPAAVAADPAREHAHAVSRAPLPDADALRAQVKALSDLGGVITPVTDLLHTVLRADDGRLPAAQATELGTAVKDAIARADAAPATTLPAPTRNGGATGAAPADVIGDALAALQKAIDELIEAVTSGDAAEISAAVTDSVASLVDTVAATLVGGRLPAPSLPAPPAGGPSN
ncbi:hypothetical protein [Streptomyces sp. NPDC093990]|uniref:hypothetical protein n=1 Tax=Streptomyces sp. NPDC093990 TaxID=3155306 RepID=UPI003417B6CD